MIGEEIGMVCRCKPRFGDFLKFRKSDSSANIFYPAMGGDVGYDFLAIEEIVIEAHGSAIVRTGLQVEIPEDYWGVIRTRSGYGVKQNIQMLHGTIDSSFRGDILVRAYNHGDRDFKVRKGDRIAQLVILPKIILPLEEVGKLTKTVRGSKGLGSTGR